MNVVFLKTFEHNSHAKVRWQPLYSIQHLCLLASNFGTFETTQL